MTPVEIIQRKRDGYELSREEIRAFIAGVTSGETADYQTAAWLMAITIQGMSERETLDLTLAMRDSGRIIDLSDLPNGPALDKHSTGGVGDKATLVVAPLLAAAGIPILKMSGRGLGHTGGTVDKLESIPGFRTSLTIEEAKVQTARIGLALVAQTGELAPADRILYSLRDVTGTVESLPLIASSIMSKKLAAGGSKIVLDVKVGAGAFMRTQDQAVELARSLVSIGESAGIPTTALLTPMQAPLGRMIGNALEVREALELLTRPLEADSHFREICLALSAHALVFMGKSNSIQAANILAQSLLDTGAAADVFAKVVKAQGGPNSPQAILASLPTAPMQTPVSLEQSGWLRDIPADRIGKLAMRLGAGRIHKTDQIDPAVGIELLCSVGDRITSKKPVALLHTACLTPEELGPHIKELQNCFLLIDNGEDIPVFKPILAEVHAETNENS